ncbi:hypothetical protein MKEN_01017300 [Mycena kentingensis (nom. inval.)]|nr:hypothetical protein MKEN_01017300 [Mycena kentingensis (nom. inval.)]
MGFIDLAPSFVYACLSLNFFVLLALNVLSTPIQTKLYLYVFQIKFEVSASFLGSASDWFEFSGLGYYCTGGVDVKVLGIDVSDNKPECGDVFWPSGLLASLDQFQDVQVKVATAAAIYATIHILSFLFVIFAMILTLAKSSPSLAAKHPRALPKDRFGGPLKFLVLTSTILLAVGTGLAFGAVELLGEKISGSDHLSVERGRSGYALMAGAFLGLFASIFVLLHDRKARRMGGGRLPR